ncbi:MAG: GFA family protein [Chloroflexota bacterium]
MTPYRVFTAIIRNESVLMVRNVHDGRDYWTLPGGRIESDESPKDAAQREVQEETGIVVEWLTQLFEEDGQVCFYGTCAPDQIARVGFDPELPADAQWIQSTQWFPLDEKRDDLQVSKVVSRLEERKMNSQNQTTGQCLCGNVRFAMVGEPIWVGHCHCLSCRRNTGSAVATFVGFHPYQVTFTQGERRFYASSPGVQRGFCQDCGTPLSYETEKFADEIHLYISTLDEPARFVPQFHTYYAERIPWFDTADDLPRHEGTSSP